MTKIMFWIVIIFAVLFALRLINVAKAKRRAATPQRRRPPPPADTMVRCVRCGVYLPQTDATPGDRAVSPAASPRCARAAADADAPACRP